VVALRRHDHAAGTHDRLGEEAGDVVGADLQDLVLELPDQVVAELRFAHALVSGLLRAIEVRGGNVVNPPVEEVKVGAAIGRASGDRTREIGAAVIGIDPADDVELGLLAAPRVVVMREPNRRVVRGRAAAGVEDLVEVTRRQRGELGGKLRRRHVGGVDEGIVEGHALRLRRHRLGDLGPAVAGVHAPEPADPVEIALAGDVGDIDSLGAVHDQRAVLLGGVEMGPGMDEMVAVLPPDVLRIDLIEIRRPNIRRAAHHAHSPSSVRVKSYSDYNIIVNLGKVNGLA
jgi:hypothetical protein